MERSSINSLGSRGTVSHSSSQMTTPVISANQIKDIRSSLIDGYYQQLKREGYNEDTIIQLVSEAIASAEWKLNETHQERSFHPVESHHHYYYNNGQYESSPSFSEVESENAMPPMESYFTTENMEGMSSFNCSQSQETTPRYDEYEERSSYNAQPLATLMRSRQQNQQQQQQHQSQQEYSYGDRYGSNYMQNNMLFSFNEHQVKTYRDDSRKYDAADNYDQKENINTWQQKQTYHAVPSTQKGRQQMDVTCSSTTTATAATTCSSSQTQLFQLKEKLRIVFMFYVSFGDRSNVSHLRSQKFHKMMSDAQLVDSTTLTKNALDLMFVKEIANKHIMDFETFLNLVTAIGKVKFSKMPQHEALRLVLEKHFLPLYENILNETDLGQVEIKHKQPIGKDVLEALKQQHQLLTQIYQTYFIYEWRGVGDSREVIGKSEQSMLKFLKEFDLCPAVMTKSSVFLLFHQILETSESDLTRNTDYPHMDEFFPENQGSCFTFHRFAVSIVRLASICYQGLMKPGQNPMHPSQTDELNVLLDRMQISEGYLNLNRKSPLQPSLSAQSASAAAQTSRSRNLSRDTSRSNMNTTSSQSNSVHQSSSYSNQSSKLRTSRDSSQPQFLRNKSPLCRNEQIAEDLIKAMRNYKLLKNPFELTSLKYPENVVMIDQNIDCLLRIFTTYCSFGDAMNTSQMTSAKFSKLIKESKILTSFNASKEAAMGGFVSQSDIEIIFIKATKKPTLRLDKQKGAASRLTFETFNVCLEMIADKLYPQYSNNAFPMLLETFIMPMDPQIQQQQYNRTSTDYPIEFSPQIDDPSEFVGMLMDILKDQEVVELLKYVHKALLPSFKDYSENKGTIPFEKFARFAKDFGIFPDIMAKLRLLKMFNTLAQIYNTAVPAQPSAARSIPLIDEHLFAESVALMACEIVYASSEYQPSYAEKICNLIVRMNQSAVTNSIAKHITNPRSYACFDITSQIRKKFPQYFTGPDTSNGSKSSRYPAEHHGMSNQGNNSSNSQQSSTTYSGSQLTKQRSVSSQLQAKKPSQFDEMVLRNLNS